MSNYISKIKNYFFMIHKCPTNDVEVTTQYQLVEMGPTTEQRLFLLEKRVEELASKLDILFAESIKHQDDWK